MIRWEAPGPYAVAFSTRVGGVSEGPFASLNLGRLTADEEQRVEENRRRLLREVGGEAERMTMNRQVHSAIVRHAQPGERGVPGDGLWTDAPALPLLALAADCMPIALARERGERPGIAVLHAGWRGLLGGIAASGVAALDGGPVAAVIGPGIGPCCYDVGEEVATRYRRAFGLGLVRDGKLDLWSAAERALRAAGCVRVDRVDLCTACNPDRFFSHRRDDGLTGRQGVLGLIA